MSILDTLGLAEIPEGHELRLAPFNHRWSAGVWAWSSGSYVEISQAFSDTPTGAIIKAMDGFDPDS